MSDGGGERPGSPTRDLATTVSAVAAALTAAATLVIVPGSIALYLRLQDQHLPADLGVVVSLPSQFLIGIGVGYLLLPLLVIAGFAVIVLLVPGVNEPNPKLPAPKPLWKDGLLARTAGWVITVLVLFGVAVAAELPSLFFDTAGPWWVIVPTVGLAVTLWILASSVVAAQKQGPLKGLQERIPAIELACSRARWDGVMLLTFVVVLAAGLPFALDSEPPFWSFAISAATTVVWLALSEPITRKYEARPLGLPAVTMIAVWTIFIFLPWAVDFAALRGEFPRATVCTSDGGRFDGVLIGETSDRVYIGEPVVQVVAFVPEELQRVVEESLREAGDDVILANVFEGVSFRRADAVVVNLENRTVVDLERLVRAAKAPELGFVRKGELNEQKAPARDAGIDLLRSRSRIESNLPALIDLLLTRADKDEGDQERSNRRISSVPLDRVSQIFIGGTGTCPAVLQQGP